MTKKRTGDPWLTPPEYGRTLAGVSLNFIVRSIERSLPFYTGLLGFRALYSDADFAALEWGDVLPVDRARRSLRAASPREGHGIKVQLHADHTWDRMPWHDRLAAGEARGLGAEVRILGPDPDATERLAREAGFTVVLGATDFPGHAWREVYLEDPDGYLWVVGRTI
jgi:catechol 2,3-dioxygenase-like lactoylglutathione lyase family enzyme